MNARRVRRVVTDVALLLGTGLLVWLVVTHFRSWQQKGRDLDRMVAEQAAWQAGIAQVERLHTTLQPMPFKVCNDRAEPVRVDWIYAAYPDGGKMTVFDSSRCADWEPVVIGDGKTQTLSLSSAEPGCNWPGRTVFYAMSFSRSDAYFNVAGPWGVTRGGSAWSKPDCYNIQ